MLHAGLPAQGRGLRDGHSPGGYRPLATPSGHLRIITVGRRNTRGRESMKVVTLKDIPDLPVEGADRIEGWTGPVSRTRQTIIEAGDSPNYNCSVVNFSQGCTTGWHTHSCDQLLIVTSGTARSEERRV